MTQVSGARTMAVIVRAGGAHRQERRIRAQWRRPDSAIGSVSQPGVGIFTYDHEVTGLPAPAAFRVLVRARWIDRHHRVIRREMIVSPICVQPLLQPDLSIGLPIGRAAAGGGNVLYSVVVNNSGTAAAGPFAVSLSVGGVTLAPVTVPSLAADSTQLVQFTGPRCTAGSTVVATADSANAVSEPANANRITLLRLPLRRRRRVATLHRPMKAEIHPEYMTAVVRCTCGNEFETRSTKPELRVEICSNCHPFYTGRQKLIDTGGRVERFQRRVARSRQRAAAS